jgi:hypothetical protein
VDDLEGQDRDHLSDSALTEGVTRLRRLLDRLEGYWLGDLAAVDTRGAAGADHATPAPSTASWLRPRLQMSDNTATSMVRTARALFRGPLTKTAQALCAGELSLAHAAALAHGTHDLPAPLTAAAEPALLEAARQLDPPRLRRVVAHLRQVADAEGAARQAERRYGRRGLWWAATWEAWSPSTASSTPKPATSCWPPWSRWPAPSPPTTTAAVTSGGLMPWSSWLAGPWRQASSPSAAGSAPS